MWHQGFRVSQEAVLQQPGHAEARLQPRRGHGLPGGPRNDEELFPGSCSPGPKAQGAAGGTALQAAVLPLPNPGRLTFRLQHSNAHCIVTEMGLDEPL